MYVLFMRLNTESVMLTYIMEDRESLPISPLLLESSNMIC